MSGEVRESERVIARLHPHGRALFWPCVVLIATVGAATYFYGRLPETWENLALLAGGALLIVVAWFLPFISWLSRRYVLTTRRVVIRGGLFVRYRQELLHSRGYDVTVRQNGLQAMFGSGDVLVNTGLDRPVVLRDVPGADLVQAALHDLMEKSLNPIAARRQAEASRESDETTAWGSR
ncbi:MAG: hypothetical protein JWO10_1627 [Microbacteriaceae bacterium]|nr:hypothetical protein [Microbacteriaceae bacterium]